MRYWLALPEGWMPRHAWPVVVVASDARRDFEGNLRRFVTARGGRPFILVAPAVVTCGGVSGQVSLPHTCTGGEWAAVKRAGDSAFDDAGLAAVLGEVQARWGGEAKAFLTGWEAGGHTVWAQADARAHGFAPPAGPGGPRRVPRTLVRGHAGMV